MARDRGPEIGAATSALAGTLAALSLTACVAIYEGTPLELPASGAPRESPALVVGVQEPAIHMDDDRGTHAWKSQQDAARAIALANALRETGRFARADLTKQLPCEPDLVLVPVPNPDHPSHDNDNEMLLIALGAIPVIDTWDRGHYFVRRDAKSDSYLFPWQRVEVIWWLSAPLALLPSWHLGHVGDLSADSFARFIDANWAALTRGVTPRRDAKCLTPAG